MSPALQADTLPSETPGKPSLLHTTIQYVIYFQIFPVVPRISLNVDFFLIFFFSYLAALGLRSSLQYTGSSVVACKLLVTACRI